ncbi:dna ligase 4 [Lichtheimia corymbifera JMRC:FSU:9682]|uniref:DNA ligase 4 n=1 Tax=Lichtheimia corymbifera JMRC:FSU:9682 TaxID=1263082 RepID=A0A068RRY7_9FUNG|nr:dna ligase 4 [Lichtheimia corymbifera JMRC:FSU:9682]
MKAVVGWCTKTQPHEFRIDRSLLLPFINTTHTRLIMSQPQNHEPLASFYNLCELFERLANTRGTDLKKRLFQRYLHDWRHHFGYDFYDAMRLFLPHLDRRRFNMKEIRLARIYTEALGLSRSSRDAIELIKYKQPPTSTSPHQKKATGDFPAVAFDVINERSTVLRATRTIHDVNNLLDKISEASGNDKATINIFKDVLNTYMPLEQKWLIRIILKDLNIGMTDNSILQVYHPQARERYAHCSNLEKVCKELQDPYLKLNQSTIQLFQAFKPQLGTRDRPKDFSSLHHQGRFYIEEKIDGERIQMHFDQRTKQFMWFSRRATDYTSMYGGFPDKDNLARNVVSCLKADTLILDGEMVAYDPKLDVFLPFGTLKSAAKDQSMDMHRARPCFVVFDIVFCNGTPLLGYPLWERLKVLNKVVTEKYGYLNLLGREEKKTMDDVTEALDHAIQMRQEGIIIKNPNSVYEPGARNHTWVKIKPEYMNSSSDNFDLLVVGGSYGSGRRGNKLSQFLCVIRDDRVEDDENPRFISFCMIGTGYTLDELGDFKEAFKDHQPYDPKRQPPWLIHPEYSSERPDVIMSYKTSLVVEITAAETISSNSWGTGYTLRFPRFVQFRRDKSWKDIMTWSDMLRTMRRQKTREVTSGNFKQHRKKRQRTTPTASGPTRVQLGLLGSQQGVDTRDIVEASSLFLDMTFYVVTGDEAHSKATLEAMIKENGGTFMQQARNTQYVVADILVQGIIRQGIYDVILPQWIVDCVEKQDLIPLQPKYMKYTTKRTEEAFSASIDKWGDSYMQDATEQSLREVMERMPLNVNDDTRELANEIQERYFQTVHIPGRIFQLVKSYIDDDPPDPNIDINDMDMTWVVKQRAHERLEMASVDLRFRGAEVTRKIEDGITHVISDENDMERIPRLIKAFKNGPLPHFVTTEWVDACVLNKTLVNEKDYQPKLPRNMLKEPTTP